MTINPLPDWIQEATALDCKNNPCNDDILLLKEALLIAWEALILSDFYLRAGRTPLDIYVARQAIRRIQEMGK